MNTWRFTASTSVVSLGLMLAACGGGGGGTNSTPPPAPAPTAPTPTPSTPTPTPSTPTPTPSTPTPTPPPTGANDDLLTPLASETFRNVAATGALSVPLSGAAVTTSSGPVTLSFVYDAATQSYTLSDGTRSQTFAPSNIDAIQSNAALTTYKVTSGGTTDTFSLLTTGIGPGQTRYVGGGFWQRQVNGTSTVDGRFTAFAYGVQTVDGALPRTGTASFDVKLIGASSFETLISALAGTGTVDVDFQSGAMAVAGRFSQTNVSTGMVQPDNGWQGRGRLSSSANAFTGELIFDALGTAEWRGALFGPAGEELGSVFSGNTASLPASAMSGVIIGARNATSPPVNLLANGSMQDRFFRPLSVGGRGARDGSGNLSAISAGTGLTALYEDTPGGVLTYYGGDGRIIRTLPGSTTLFAADAGSSLTYLKASLLVDRRSAQDLFDAFIYGTETTNAAVPRTGSGSFNLTLAGTVAVPGANLQQLTGNGALTANFATGAITTLGNYSVRAAFPGAGFNGSTPTSDSGSWTGSATLSSTANSFAGTFAMDGATDYNGTLLGRFYGPAAEEVGAVVQATAGNGAMAIGTLAGARGAGAGGSQTGLLDLTGATVLAGRDAEFLTSTNGQTTVLNGAIEVTYDPVAKTYQFKSTTSVPGPAPLDRTLTEGIRNGGASNATFTAYQGTGFTARLFNPRPTNPSIALTYTSFAEIVQDTTVNGFATNAQHYVVFGGQTPNFQVPTTGAATYTGVVYGMGRHGSLANDAALTGSSTLNVNFASNAISLLLDTVATDKVTGTALDLPDMNFVGTLGGLCPGGCNRSTFLVATNPSMMGPNGQATGQFNGPDAAEFAATFKFDMSGGTNFAGITVGKKN